MVKGLSEGSQEGHAFTSKKKEYIYIFIGIYI
jgi:hypothetical protein